jgi:hypothetical protein
VLQIGIDRIGLGSLPSSDSPQLSASPPVSVTPVPVTQPVSAPPVSVMEWLVTVGHAVARRVRGVPPSPMVRLYPKS